MRRRSLEREPRDRVKRPVLYLVSGDDNIKPSHDVLRRTGRRVRYDDAVSDDAALELREGKQFIVVAHGQSDGTVSWFSSSRGSASRWVWVGMDRPPRRTRVYFYSCKAGKKLPHYLKDCESFGHVDVVPMPTGAVKSVVLGFLKQVEYLVSSTHFDFARWRDYLARYVNKALVQEVENPTGLLNANSLLMLRRSLGNVDP